MVDRYDEELFLGYVEGDLSPEQNARFEKLLTEDARLRNLVAQLLIDRQRLRQMPDEKAPADLMAGVNDRLERAMLLSAPADERERGVAVRNFKFMRWAAYSGLAAMVLISAALFVNSLTRSQLLEQADSIPVPGPLASSAPAAPGRQEIATDAPPSGPEAIAGTSLAQQDDKENADPVGAAGGDSLVLAETETGARRMVEKQDKATADSKTLGSDAPAEPGDAPAFGADKNDEALLKDLAKERARFELAAKAPGGAIEGDRGATAAVTAEKMEESNHPASLADGSLAVEGQAERKAGVILEDANGKMKLALKPATAEKAMQAPAPAEAAPVMAAAAPSESRMLAYRARQARATQLDLELSARDAVQSQQRLVDWATSNRIDVVESGSVAGPAAVTNEPGIISGLTRTNEREQAGLKRNDQLQAQTSQRVVLLVRGTQVPSLLAHVNRQSDQRVSNLASLRTRQDADELNAKSSVAKAEGGGSGTGGANVALDAAQSIEENAATDADATEPEAIPNAAVPRRAAAPADEAGWDQLVAEQLEQLPAEALDESGEVNVSITIVPESPTTVAAPAPEGTEDAKVVEAEESAKPAESPAATPPPAAPSE